MCLAVLFIYTIESNETDSPWGYILKVIRLPSLSISFLHHKAALQSNRQTISSRLLCLNSASTDIYPISDNSKLSTWTAIFATLQLQDISLSNKFLTYKCSTVVTIVLRNCLHFNSVNLHSIQYASLRLALKRGLKFQFSFIWTIYHKFNCLDFTIWITFHSLPYWLSLHHSPKSLLRFDNSDFENDNPPIGSITPIFSLFGV